MTQFYRFKTDRFAVIATATECDYEPDWLDGEDQRDLIRKINCGDLIWFNAEVAVYLDGRKVAADTLGGCCYESLDEFTSSHRDSDPMNRNCSIMRAARGDDVCIGHYFPDMVRIAIAEARKALANTPRIRAQESAS